MFAVIPIGGDFSDGERRRHLDLRPRHAPPAGRPADRHPAGPGHVVDRGVRRDARRLVVGLEVPAARLGPGVGADGLLRGGPRPVGRRRRARRRHADHQRHRRRPEHRGDWNLWVTGVVPFVIFLIAGTAELNRRRSTSSRPSRSSSAAPHRVQLDPLRALLPGRVHEHDHDVGDHRHAVPRRPDGPLFIGSASSGRLFWFFAKLIGPPVLLRLVPGHAAPVPLRPADGPRLEGADPARSRLAAGPRRASGSATRSAGTGTPSSSPAVRRVSSPPPTGC